MIVYYFNDFDSAGEREIERMLDWMPRQQVELVSGMKSLARRREQAMSYAMLAYALQNDSDAIFSKELNVKAIPISILHFVPQQPPLWRVAEHGKPYLTNYENIFFNISHCQQAIVTAVSDCETGIDVEGRRRFSDTLLQRAFNDEEQALVAASDDPEREFARIWTRKEAWLKYTGTGILMEHLKTTEAEAAAAQCAITTQLITPTPPHEPFYLSIATPVGGAYHS